VYRREKESLRCGGEEGANKRIGKLKWTVPLWEGETGMWAVSGEGYSGTREREEGMAVEKGKVMRRQKNITMVIFKIVA